jgi:hypothetical protein
MVVYNGTASAPDRHSTLPRRARPIAALALVFSPVTLQKAKRGLRRVAGFFCLSLSLCLFVSVSLVPHRAGWEKPGQDGHVDACGFSGMDKLAVATAGKAIGR